MDSLNRPIAGWFPCNCCNPSKLFSSTTALGQHLSGGLHLLAETLEARGNINSNNEELQPKSKETSAEASPARETPSTEKNIDPGEANILSTPMHECKRCYETFDSEAMLEDHAKIHDKTQACEVCGKIFPDKYRLKKHIVIHSDVKEHTCSECSKAFYSYDGLKRHVYSHHTDNIPIYECPKCDRKFKIKTHFNYHVMKHSGQTPYGCDVCGRQYKNPSDLGKHKITHRNAQKCLHCPRTFKNASHLREHERTHANPEVFPCSFCDKKFKVRRLLTRHEKIHIEQRPQCPVCKVTFRSASYLQKHYAAIHEEKGGFTCPMCNKKFVEKTRFDAHVAAHRPEPPQQCSRCPFLAPTKEVLKKHAKIHIVKKKKIRKKKAIPEIAWSPNPGTGVDAGTNTEFEYFSSASELPQMEGPSKANDTSSVDQVPDGATADFNAS